MQYTSPFILIAPSRYACFREITTSRPSALLTLDDIQPSREPGPEHRMTMMYIQMAAAVKLNNHVHDCSLVNFDYTCAQVANCLRAAKHFYAPIQFRWCAKRVVFSSLCIRSYHTKGPSQMGITVYRFCIDASEQCNQFFQPDCVRCTYIV